ncbi:hypothetical protein G3I40_19685 [Streptomyces sp. SID14478]|uniref:hypothetical protein n=1 Tax=Streptomyces sp. SID14478 TaxID=2706073 RepID=UPI0013DC3A96|nr:hypothetical protein [Streptomyces sp. SID14478]NEB77422.1 hypothetical protein [Streptomyces sp. SID14478]
MPVIRGRISARTQAAAALALLLPLAGCADPSPLPPRPSDLVGRAADRAGRLGAADGTQTTVMNGATTTWRTTYSWGEGYATDATTDADALGMGRLTKQRDIRCLLVDGVYYYDVDPQPSGPLRGKEWMKVDSSAVYGDEGARVLRGDSPAHNPAYLLDRLRATGSVTKEDDGEKGLTHYKGALKPEDLGDLRALYFPKKPNAFSPATGYAAIVLVDTWIGSDGLPARITEHIGGLTIDMNFRRFHATAGITAPPPDRVGDMTAQYKKAYGTQ